MTIIPGDSVVIAAGVTSENRLFHEIGDLVPEIYLVGDAKEPRKAMEAIREGFYAGFQI